MHGRQGSGFTLGTHSFRLLPLARIRGLKWALQALKGLKLETLGLR